MYIIDPFTFERSYFLFFGVYGVVNTYVYYIGIQKILYVNLGANGLFPITIGLLLLIGMLVGINWMNIKALYTGMYDRMQRNERGTVGWIPVVSGFGYVIGQVLLFTISGERAHFSIMILILSLFSLITAVFSIFIHRYIFISKHMDDVKKIYPEFGMPKNARLKDNVM